MRRLLFIFILLIISSFFVFKLFYPIYISQEVIITYGIHPFDICSKNPELWKYIKITYIITFIFSNIIINNFLYSKIYKLINSKLLKSKRKKDKKTNSIKFDSSKLSLLIGYDFKNNTNISIPESGLYQNFLITGTIGSR